MPACTAEKIEFGLVGRRVIALRFSGGGRSGAGGVVLLRCMDERLGLTAAAAAAIGDDWQSRKVRVARALVLGMHATHAPLHGAAQAADRCTAPGLAEGARRRGW